MGITLFFEISSDFSLFPCSGSCDDKTFIFPFIIYHGESPPIENLRIAGKEILCTCCKRRTLGTLLLHWRAENSKAHFIYGIYIANIECCKMQEYRFVTRRGKPYFFCMSSGFKQAKSFFLATILNVIFVVSENTTIFKMLFSSPVSLRRWNTKKTPAPIASTKIKRNK